MPTIQWVPVAQTPAAASTSRFSIVPGRPQGDISGSEDNDDGDSDYDEKPYSGVVVEPNPTPSAAAAAAAPAPAPEPTPTTPAATLPAQEPPPPPPPQPPQPPPPAQEDHRDHKHQSAPTPPAVPPAAAQPHAQPPPATPAGSGGRQHRRRRRRPLMTSQELSTFLWATMNNINSQHYRPEDVSEIEDRFVSAYYPLGVNISSVGSISAVRKATLSEMCWLVLALGRDPIEIESFALPLCQLGTLPPLLALSQSQLHAFHQQQQSRRDTAFQLPLSERFLQRALSPSSYHMPTLTLSEIRVLEYRWSNALMVDSRPITASDLSAQVTSTTAFSRIDRLITAAISSVATASAVGSADTASAAAPASKGGGRPKERERAGLDYDALSFAADSFYWLRFRLRLDTQCKTQVVLPNGQLPNEVFQGEHEVGVDEDRLKSFLHSELDNASDARDAAIRDAIRTVYCPIGAWTRYVAMNPERKGDFFADDVAKSALTHDEWRWMDDQAACRPQFRQDIIDKQRDHKKQLEREWAAYVKKCKDTKEEVAQAIHSAKTGEMINPDILATYIVEPTAETCDVWYLMAFDVYWKRLFHGVSFVKHQVIGWGDWGVRRNARINAHCDGVARLELAYRNRATTRPFLVHLGHNEWYVWCRGHLLRSTAEYDIRSERHVRRALLCCIALWIRIIQRDYAGTFGGEGNDGVSTLPATFAFWSSSKEQTIRARVQQASAVGYQDPFRAVVTETRRLERMRREHDDQRRRLFTPPIAATSSAASAPSSSAPPSAAAPAAH